MSAFFVSSTPIISALRGFARAHSDRVALTEDPLFVRSRTRTPERRVGLVSGGGSGHEPMHVGFVGQGMLDAAVPGEVFASPHNAQIFAASRAVAGPDGVLHIVKNYTGDVINFAIAAERLQAAGIPTRTVIVDDDIATDSDETETGRRGTGATVVVEKILGAAADSGLGLDELADLGAEVADRSRSLAVAARAQTDSHTGRPAFDLAEGTLEYGVGIHGERAASSIGREDFDALVARMVDEVHAAVAGDPADGDLLVFVNGLGATTQIELFNVFDAVTRSLETKGERVTASLVGNYVTALDMTGFSITLTRMQPQWLDWWETATCTAAFPAPVADGTPTASIAERGTDQGGADETDAGTLRTRAQDRSTDLETAVVIRFAELAEEHHGHLTRLDQVTGDGDFGDNLRGGLRHTTRLMEEADAAGFAAAERAFLNGVGGTSGPLLGLLFQELNAGYAKLGDDEHPRTVWEQATAAGSAAIRRVGGAEPGDRTVIDVLEPTASALSGGFASAAETAADAAQATAELQARRGRASYVDGRGHGTPDAGAVGISLLFTAAAEVYER
ncbi:dihydroxyacetone kinase subunit DhaK [Brevibacterium casei]|uniref:Homodimeric dihydroxyacetone kinase n=1 Tax=Brevibacterium casei CIP 102111 TaxID=1255625 RepID=A0A2H1J4B5_9MICO|nr:dihydroxyacetone kinase subunit DhaK [Brevibacterium casei]MCT1448388.1 dihydroxyacetone kinase subunit DhaK [Brevibacterium casei]MDH5147412.1 dihydroxyacetone kinase subunit DhaK [Brevibacterium casei]QPR39338.1 dihydroxyacetone kinase subunit DhaK [Brevibacterium casei]QPR43503.1 dihydroxyacetone kinase subunit DhaK [Brevibacterium casei]SMX82234.1 homodimeric dihydroxyacetone kinase [Brevibacterium casei CIP 102111]